MTTNDSNGHPKMSAEDAYLNAHMAAQGLVEHIQELLADMPAPGDDEHPIHWGHVGSANEVKRRLAEVVAFLDGTER